MKKLFRNMLNSKIAIGIAAIAVIVSIGFMKQPAQNTNADITKNKIAPALKNIDIEYKNYSVDARKGSKIKYFETGSIITIPDDAFVDGEGKLIKGKVDIKYREFHDPVDFFISGIPMTYDSAGEKYHFESAGMLELLAFQCGKPVFMNSSKKIVVEMASGQSEDKYNIYKYNPLQGNWSYVYKDKAIHKVGDETKDVEKRKTAGLSNKAFVKTGTINEKNLIAPLKSNENKFHFDIAIDSVEFPELYTYKGVLFEVDNTGKDFNPLYASATWNDISLEKGKSKESYLMTLSRGTETHSFETVPVLQGKDYDEALTTYKKQLRIRKEKEKRDQRTRDSLFTLLNRERLDQNEFAKNALNNASASMQTQDIVVRVFVISGFGIWNSDCPSSMPRGEQFAAHYTDTLGNKLAFSEVYLVEKGRNAMFKIYSGSDISFNPKKKNCLWAVTKDNKLAVFMEDDFRGIKIKNDSATVVMKIIDKPITKALEVRSILKI